MNKKIIVAAVAALSAVSMAETVNNDIWFNGTSQIANTTKESLEPNYENSSYWYDYDDRANDKGGSYIKYLYDSTGNYGSFIQPMIDSLGYIFVKYVLVDPTTTGQNEEYPYNFVGMGFNLVGAAQDPLDITSAEGLCATYTSDDDVTLTIDADGTGNASCSAKLTKTATPTLVDLDFSKFSQPTWTPAAQKVSSCAEAFAKATAVKFQIDGQASDAQGALRIFEVGPKGTCKGEKAVSQKEKSANSCDHHADPDAISQKAVSAANASLSGRILSFSGIKSASYEIANVQGQVVKSGKVEASINLAGLKAGIYMVRISGKSVNMNKKILLK